MQSNSSAAFVVHNLVDAKRALEIATTAGANVTLLSPPSAASTLGPRVFNEMIRAAMTDIDCGAIDVDAVVDCGDAAGPALRAIKHGSQHIACSAPSNVMRKIEDIAAASGARVRSTTPPAINLGNCDLSDMELIAWVKADETSSHV